MRYAILLALVLGSCASVGYQHFVLDLPTYEQGILRGPKPKDDLPVSVCTPDQASQSKCIVVLEEVWDTLQRELIEMRERLEACEKTCGS